MLKKFQSLSLWLVFVWRGVVSTSSFVHLPHHGRRPGPVSSFHAFYFCLVAWHIRTFFIFFLLSFRFPFLAFWFFGHSDSCMGGLNGLSYIPLIPYTSSHTSYLILYLCHIIS
jgi:hypothetical protein